MPSICEQVQVGYHDIKTLKGRFNLEWEKAKETGDLAQVKELRAELEQKRAILDEKLWPFTELPASVLHAQYESQKAIFQSTGLLAELDSGELGIRAIDDKEYPFPSLPEIRKKVRKQMEILMPKIEQGFNQLLIVPFGLRLDDLIGKYRQVILKHHREGKLLATKADPADPDEHLELDESQSVWVLNKYANADLSGELYYFPKEFSQNHQGQTKQQLLKKAGGFNILLMEDLPNIPREGRGTELKQRKQLEAGASPDQYLETLKADPQYQNETGMTPEEQISYAIQYLEETNQIIDDYQGNGSMAYQLGSYFPASSDVPSAFWYRNVRRANLVQRSPWHHATYIGVRSAVRVKT